MEEDLKSKLKKKENDCKDQEDQILELHSQLEKEKNEKKEAIEKVNAISRILQPQDLVMDKEVKGEYMEEFSLEDKNASVGVKRKSEAADEEDAHRKKTRCSF